MVHGKLMYNNTKLVISSTKRQRIVISDVYIGLGHHPRVKAALTSQSRGDSTSKKISKRFFWYNIKGDVEEFIKKYDQCQKWEKI